VTCLERFGLRGNRIDEHAVRGVDVAVGVDEQVGGRDRRVQRLARFRRGLPRLGQQLRHAREFSGHARADVCGFCRLAMGVTIRVYNPRGR
jgi:hypothetical protein